MKSAHDNTYINTINIESNIGDTSNYTLYNVNRTVTIQGDGINKIYGCFKVYGGAPSFRDLVIMEKDTSNVLSQRVGIDVLSDTVTITGCSFDASGAGEKLVNAICLYPQRATQNWVITGNTFNGYNVAQSGYSSAAVLVNKNFDYDVSRYNGSLLNGRTKSVGTLSATNEELITMMKTNTFTNGSAFTVAATATLEVSGTLNMGTVSENYASCPPTTLATVRWAQPEPFA